MFLSMVMPDSAIALDVYADDWHEAIQLAGRGLEASGVADRAYTRAMIQEVEKHGPYIVVAPGIALAHALPCAAVHDTGLSLVRLAEPVRFGHYRYDPVRLVIGVAATDEHADLVIVSALAGVLADPMNLDQLLTATSPSEVRRILSDGELPVMPRQRTH
ncbi:PTS system, ascorbate-specific IIA component [Propionibacterium cyclohexanicum]|uniref:Ascorbate-specific PTS system EIIA component n=2 Tax=Propionibacterium cyclohexanicum TaxID=64702 RepID=A0A1H9TCT9_9ACTN|nr:PTS system, ascorbate-specific IIA component [Propionibacterium cyclohexanicum]